MTHRILVVDDDPHIRDLLVFALAKSGMITDQAADGEAALARIAHAVPDLIILDINMPRMDGLALCRQLRRGGGPVCDVPILFLSSRDDEIDRIIGIEIGGDDYVVKPFSPREVVARVGAILKRGNGNQSGRANHDQMRVPIRHHRLSLDPDAWEARWDDLVVGTTATEFQLLLLLARNPARVFSRDAIIDALHGPGFAITDRTIDSHIRNLRAKFSKSGANDLIETRAGIGYRIGGCA